MNGQNIVTMGLDRYDDLTRNIYELKEEVRELYSKLHDQKKAFMDIFRLEKDIYGDLKLELNVEKCREIFEQLFREGNYEGMYKIVTTVQYSRDSFSDNPALYFKGVSKEAE